MKKGECAGDDLVIACVRCSEEPLEAASGGRICGRWSGAGAELPVNANVLRFLSHAATLFTQGQNVALWARR